MSNYSRDTVSARFPQAKGIGRAQELFTDNFWLSGLAMLKYISRSFRAKQVHGMAFYADTKNEEFRNRVLRTKPESARQWGTMSVAQMLHHLNLACGGSLGFYTLPDESYFVSRTLFRWILVFCFPEQPSYLPLPKRFTFPH